jgi:predicted ATP-dependent endonuclease of OLD family
VKLIKVKVTNFRSIEDSNEFEISDLTCLVGKNEAGKTALLHALYGLKPFRDYSYDKTRDYPRRFLSKYDQLNPTGKSEVLKTWWEVKDKEIKLVEAKFGEGALSSNNITISHGIDFPNKLWSLDVNEKQIISYLIKKHKLNAAESSSLNSYDETEKLAAYLESRTEKTEKQELLLKEINQYRKNDVSLAIIDLLEPYVPKFFYTSHFERMSGEISLQKLAQDRTHERVSPSDQIFLDFLEYAGTSLEDLQQVGKYEELKAQCEGASNDITDEIFEFWSQNEALSVKIDLGEGRPDDEPPFNTGTIAKIRIENQNHRVTVPLSERSAGFVWFFSFLSQFKRLRNVAGNAIILLDEPGLTLHGKAQSDLLRYIIERLLPEHQVIYTTHSPFMIPSDRLADVRVVEDVLIWPPGSRKAQVIGTKVSTDILSVDKDTLFPLQGHLGYELTQSLFIGKNTLLVEGPSDIFYLQALSNALKERGRVSLSPEWTICPTGGIDKIFSFASLFGGNQLNIAVLCDLANGDKGKIQKLKQSQILNSNHVYTVSDFTGKTESDVEDIFHPDLFSNILNAAYKLDNGNKIDTTKLASTIPTTERIVKQAENLFKLMPAEVAEFDHFTPSNWLIRNLDILSEDNHAVTQTLETAEEIFKTINNLLL